MGTGRSTVARKTSKEARWTARKKADVVVRLLRGESLDELSRELRVEAHRLQVWRDEFLAGGIEGLKARPLSRRIEDSRRPNERSESSRWTTRSCGRRPEKGTSVYQVNTEVLSRSALRALKTASEIRLLRQRRASLSDLPSPTLRR